MGRRRGPCLGVTSPQRTTSKTDRRFSGFPSQARKDQKISPVLLSVCTPPFSAKAKVASADATEANQEGKRHDKDSTTHAGAVGRQRQRTHRRQSRRL